MNLKRKIKRQARPGKVDKFVHEAYQLYHHKKYQDAESSCKKIIKKYPQSGAAHKLLGMIALESRRYEQAVASFSKAITLMPPSSELHYKLGIAYRDSGLIDESRTALSEALKMEPDNASLVQLLFDIHIKLRDYNKAIAIFEDYLALKNIIIDSSCKGENNKETARPAMSDSPDAINRLNKSDKHIIVELAHMYLRTRQLSKAEAASNLVLNEDPDHSKANLALATLDRQNGELEKAAVRIQKVVNKPGKNNDRATALTELGKIYNLMERFEEAFATFQEANQTTAQFPSTRAIDKTSMPSLIQQCTDYCEKHGKESAGSFAINDNSPPPLFLVGFPRSGTTLTERILQAQLDIHTSDELPLIHEMTFYLPQLLNRPFRYPRDLDSLSNNEIQFLRNYYWKKVRESLQVVDGDRTMLLDKLPFNIIHLIFIEKIFPEARVIVALRDPRDVCISNFMQSFGMNSAMVHFLKIKDTAELYTLTMNFWLAYKQKSALLWHETRYEDLVANPEDTTLKLVQFITAKDKQSEFFLQDHTINVTDQSFSTPSYYDVTQPIYNRAAGRWKNYKKYISPVFPLLEKFIVEFGYS